MSLLHTVNKSPFNSSCLSDCLEVIGNDHSLLLIEDGVYGAIASSPLTEAMESNLKAGIKMYVLSDDLLARGISDKINPAIKVVEYSDFVQLTASHSATQSWY